MHVFEQNESVGLGNEREVMLTTLTALNALKRGDASARLPLEWTGLAGKVADTFNEVIELNARLATELQRLSVVVGEHGRIHERASLGSVTGAWAGSVQHVNSLLA
ncbi:MAG TPA: hypothetical protein VE965_02395, partial [Gammaproteobacteria bacterium]|nr:hypothetical protein [Gammaproteobacteria bacterium]